MKYWKRVDAQGEITTVESYSHDLKVQGAVEIEKADFDAFIASLPAPVITPPRDLVKELDNLKAELKGKGVIA